MEDEWMVVLNSHCRNLAKRCEVRAYDRESMKSISLGSHNLTKLNRISSSICVKGFSWNMTYGFGRTLHIAGELASFRFFFKTTPDFKHH